MNKLKIINDPVYGFIKLPFELVYDLIHEPEFQRLRRIKQLGLTHYVYPGAMHTRFHHALGALHLMGLAVQSLRDKGIDISDEESEGVKLAILLHDIGHGPYSHALEGTLAKVHHETLSSAFMDLFNQRHGGALDVAISIFNGSYQKKFLHELVSSQLDMDRMDYLKRDSFFTGVIEGAIGHDRIINMLTVRDDHLVVEEKGIYSVEKFLVARRLMYWQAYLHKTVLVAEQMLIQVMRRARYLLGKGFELQVPAGLKWFLSAEVDGEFLEKSGEEVLVRFGKLDDIDVQFAIKNFTNCGDEVLEILSRGLLNRKLFRVHIQDVPVSSDFIEKVRQSIDFKPEDKDFLVFTGSETNMAYQSDRDEIGILSKNGIVSRFSEQSELHLEHTRNVRHFICAPGKRDLFENVSKSF